MIDVQENNWLLESMPEDTQESPKRIVQRMGLAFQKIHLTSTPIFNEMQRRFWFDHFVDKSDRELRAYCHDLHIRLPRNAHKSDRVKALVEYFQSAVAEEW